MSIEVKPGRWQMRNGEMAKVLYDGVAVAGLVEWACDDVVAWRDVWNGPGTDGSCRIPRAGRTASDILTDLANLLP